MTRRYDLTLNLRTYDGKKLITLEVVNKTMETVQQLVRLAMSDFEKTDQAAYRKPLAPPKRVQPPIEIMDTPTADDIATLTKEV